MDKFGIVVDPGTLCELVTCMGLSLKVDRRPASSTSSSTSCVAVSAAEGQSSVPAELAVQ